MQKYLPYFDFSFPAVVILTNLILNYIWKLPYKFEIFWISYYYEQIFLNFSYIDALKNYSLRKEGYRSFEQTWNSFLQAVNFKSFWRIIQFHAKKLHKNISLGVATFTGRYSYNFQQ
jgi:hypothetical protein